MEHATKIIPADFSVDGLLDALGDYAKNYENSATDMTEQIERMHQAARVSEYIAQSLHDAGNTLIQEVEAYLQSDQAQEMLALQDVITQLGDMCLDHANDYAHIDETTAKQNNHSSFSGHADTDEHGHNYTANESRTRQKSKNKTKKRSPTLYDYFVRRRLAAKN